MVNTTEINMDEAFIEYVSRTDQEEKFLSKLGDHTCRIIGISAQPKMGTSVFMEHVIGEFQKKNQDILLRKIDIRYVTSKEDFHKKILKLLCNAMKVHEEKLSQCQGSDLLENIKMIIPKNNKKQIYLFLDNIPRPSDNSKRYSPKNDAQKFIVDIIRNETLRSVFKFLYTSALELRFLRPIQSCAFIETLRPLNDGEVRQMFTKNGLTEADIPDTFLHCFNSVASGNPLILQIIAAELLDQRNIINAEDMTELLQKYKKKLDVVSRENYSEDENTRHILKKFYNSLTNSLQNDCKNFIKHGDGITVSEYADKEKEPVAVTKLKIITLLRANVIQSGEEANMYMAQFLRDTINEIHGIHESNDNNSHSDKTDDLPEQNKVRNREPHDRKQGKEAEENSEIPATKSPCNLCNQMHDKHVSGENSSVSPNHENDLSFDGNNKSVAVDTAHASMSREETERKSIIKEENHGNNLHKKEMSQTNNSSQVMNHENYGTSESIENNDEQSITEKNDNFRKKIVDNENNFDKDVKQKMSKNMTTLVNQTAEYEESNVLRNMEPATQFSSLELHIPDSSQSLTYCKETAV